MTRPQLAALALAAIALATPSASAQFLYLRPDPTTTGNFLIVFHSAPLTESATSAHSLAVSSVTAVGEGGKQSQLAVESRDQSVTVKSTADTLFASVDYGVSNRGEGHLVLLRYHAKTQPVGGEVVKLKLELTPKAVSGGVAFVATANGKPFGNATVTVHEPGAAEPKAVMTDADGQTPTYTKAGRYAARVSRFEKQKGEHEGKAFTGVWEYSTLVTSVK